LRREGPADYDGRAMIDYAVLCTAIENWKAGQKPSAAPPPAPRRAAPRPVEPVQEEEPVEYSAVYDAGELAEAAEAAEAAEVRPEEPVESTVIYQLPDDYSEGEVVEEEER
jgi:hypothetical protein